MSLERAIHGPMKWVPPPAAGPAGAPVSPTPSYTTASSTSLSAVSSAPSTPAVNYYDPRWAQHATPPPPYDPRHGGAQWASSSSSSPPPPWAASPLSPPLLTHHQYHAVPSPGGASSRSGYEGDRDDRSVVASGAIVGGSRPSSSSSTLSSTSSTAAASSSSSAPRQGTTGGPPRRIHRADAVPTATTAALPAESRALALLEVAVEEQANFTVVPRGKEGKRQCASQLKALNLFDEQYSLGESNDPPPPPPPTASGLGQLDDFKSDLDKIRQRGAGMRALDLLNDTAAGEKYKGSPPPSSYSPKTLTARRAAQLAHEKRQAEKERVQAQLKKDLEKYGRRIPKTVVPVRKEALAESTRPKKAQTEDDVRDPETVSGMKCQLHWDREKEAQVKALRLLNEESAAMVSIL